MNKKTSWRKRLVIIIVVLALLAGTGTGAGLYLRYRGDQKTVEVLPMTNVSTTYWGDQTTCSGNIVSDFVQELYPDTSKTISEIFVQEGQEVKVGDPLLQYDRTSLELDVEAKEIAVKQAEVKLDEANRQLKKYQNTKPSSNNVVVPTRKPTPTPKPTPKPTPTPTPTPEPTPDVPVYKLLTVDSLPYKGSGTTKDPYVFLCENGFSMTPGFLRLLWGLDGATPTPAPTPAPEPSWEPDPTPTAPPQPTEAPTPEPEPTDTPVPPEPDPTDSPASDPDPTADPGPEVSGVSSRRSYSWERYAPPPEDGYSLPLASPFAAVFEVREHNHTQGKLLYSLTLDGTQLSVKFDLSALLQGAVAVGDIAVGSRPVKPLVRAAATPTPNPDNYNHMGYTSADLKKLIKEKKQEITGLNLDLKQAKLNLEKSKRALANSTVTSTVDGQVRSLIDLEAAMAESKPFMVVTGAQQYYVSGSLSENLLGSVAIGDQVSITCYGMNGMSSYTAQIVSISDYPMEGGGFYGSGNPNSSNYEFSSVILDPDDSIQTGSYVEINMNVTGGEEAPGDALYLYSPYLREDDAGYYVLKAGTDNRLVKQYIQVGKSIWGGDYYEIKSGLTLEDFVAFPYGSDAKEGVRVLVENTEEPPFPEEDGSAPENSESSGLTDSSIPEGGEDSGLEDGDTPEGDEDGSLEDGGEALPDGAVITGRDENGTYFETENGGGVILD